MQHLVQILAPLVNRPSRWVMAAAFGLAVMAGAGRADETRLLRVNAFPNAKALPFHAGIAQGMFEKRGLKIELHLTDNSRNQRDGLASAKFDIAPAALARCPFELVRASVRANHVTPTMYSPTTEAR